MRNPHKAFIVILAVLTCMVLVSTAFAQSTRVVSNVLQAMPPANGGGQDPDPAEEPGSVEEPENSGDPQLPEAGFEEGEDPDIPEEEPEAGEELGPEEDPAGAPEFMDDLGVTVDLPEGASIKVIAMIRQQGEEPAFGDSVVLHSTLAGLDGYTVALQWQQYKDNQWVDLTGATETSLSFVLTPENACDYWRLTATVYGNVLQQAEHQEKEMPS